MIVFGTNILIIKCEEKNVRLSDLDESKKTSQKKETF